MTRGQRGRAIGRAMIALAVVLGVVLPIFLFVAAPGGLSPMFDEPPWPPSWVPYFVGVIGVIVGLTWMIRIHRADPEPDQHAWRYRARR